MTAQTAEVLEQPIQPLSLRDTVTLTMKNYLKSLDGEPVGDIYDMVISEVEAPMRTKTTLLPIRSCQ